MRLYSKRPVKDVLKNYVDCYQLYYFDKAITFKSIPNGKLELWVIFNGGFEIWNNITSRFESAKRFGLHPPSNKTSSYKIEDHMVCLNIKFKPLAIQIFTSLLQRHLYPNLSFQEIFNNKDTQEISDYHTAFKDSLDIGFLEDWLQKLITRSKEESLFQNIIWHLVSIDDQNIRSVAQKLNVTERTIQRVIKEQLDLSPKEFCSIDRLCKTTEYLRRDKSRNMIEALNFGYYDHSHFIKECRKITGHAPKKLLSKMKLPTNDLIFD